MICNVKMEIDLTSDISDRPILLWLFVKYGNSSQWYFVARRINDSYPYECRTKWVPTPEGRALYRQIADKCSSLFLIEASSTSSMHPLTSIRGVIDGIEQDAKDYCAKMNCECKSVYRYSKLERLA